MKMKSYTPLRITFYLISPVCLAYPWIHFDGLLGHLKARAMMGEDYYTLPSKEPLPLDLDLPLRASKTVNDKFVYHASVSIFDSNLLSTATIYKRFYDSSIAESLKKTKIDLGRGLFKNYMMRMPYLPAKTCTFYACGDLDEIKSLISNLAGLGKKVDIGFGGIRSFEIAELNQDFSLVMNGKAMRPIPIELCKFVSEKMMMAYKGPYWDKRNVVLCAPPGAEVKLR